MTCTARELEFAGSRQEPQTSLHAHVITNIRPFSAGSTSLQGLVLFCLQDYLELDRPSEINAKDEIFSPFVAAGWKSAVERNMRPGQWLGFLKILTCLGAEYVETGFFSPLQFNKNVHNVQLPQVRVQLIN